MEWLTDWFYNAWEFIYQGAVEILKAIPVPEWLGSVGALWAAIPDSVLFFLQSFAIPEGLAIVGSAYGIRFLIRRIPIIG